MKKIFILFLCFISISCSNNKRKEDGPIIVEHDYQEVADKKILWIDLFHQVSNDYYVYFYFEHCSHCHSIKNEVIHYALNSSKIIYFCNDDNIVVHNYDTTQTIGVKIIDLMFIKGFPSIVKVDNHSITKNICGANKVIEELRVN